MDETGKGVAGIPMVFSGAGTSKTVPTDASGVAKWKAATESVDVTFESAEAVNKAMKTVWQSRVVTPLDAYLAEGSDVVAVTSRPSAVEALGGDLFNSLSVAAAPLAASQIQLGEGLPVQRQHFRHRLLPSRP